MSTSTPTGGLSGRGPRDPYENYRIARENFLRESGSLDPQDISLFLGFMTLFLKKCKEFFEPLSERGLTSLSETDLRNHLLLLKNAFALLQMQDCSQDFALLMRLSKLWQALLEDLLHFRKETPFGAKLRVWVQKIQSYPAEAPYSLGYYLSEYAGQSWLPFPYLELIKNLHADSSALMVWIKDLDSLILMLA